MRKGKLVAPGFIDTHVHSGHRASHRLITDAGRGDYFGQPFFEISVPKEGTRIDGDVRYLRPQETGMEAELELHALFTVAELLRNGVTTFVEYGSQLRIQEALMTQCLALGVRGYLGPGYDSGRWVGDEHGRLKRVLTEENGRKEFADAVKWIERHDGAGGGLIKGILVPREMETCSIDLLRMTREKADEMKLPMATHAAYSIIEFYEVVREHRKTPIEILADLGMLRPTLNIGHGNLPADSVRLNYPGAQDLKLMGAAGVSISHCPINIVRRARVLDNWQRYTELGINIALGSDTYPRDMMLNMRTASYHGKVMSHNYKSATAADVFSAATVGGAKSLGRDDLGRLAPGARADIILIDLSGKGNAAHGTGARSGQDGRRMRRRRRRRHRDRRGRDSHGERTHSRRGPRRDPTPRPGSGRADLGELAYVRSARPHARGSVSVVVLSGVVSGRRIENDTGRRFGRLRACWLAV